MAGRIVKMVKATQEAASSERPIARAKLEEVRRVLLAAKRIIPGRRLWQMPRAEVESLLAKAEAVLARSG